MGSFYRLLIQCDVEKKNTIDSILGKSNGEPEIGWNFVIEEDSPLYINALNIFTDLISNSITSLKEVGVVEEMITFWYMYEFEQQCNMEFSPDLMKKMGELGIVLCVSCWEK